MSSAATCLQWPDILENAGHVHSDEKPVGVSWMETAYGSGSLPFTCPVAAASAMASWLTAPRRT